jgi:hypothetical protein
MRNLFTLFFTAQTFLSPMAHAAPRASDYAKQVPCLAKYYKDSSEINVQAQGLISAKYDECGKDCLNDTYCDELVGQLSAADNATTEASAAPCKDCDSVEPQTTADTDRSHLDKDSVGDIEDVAEDDYTPDPPTRVVRVQSQKSGGGFLDNGVIGGLLVGGLLGVAGTMLFNNLSGGNKNHHNHPRGPIYGPRIPMYASNPLGLRPIPGMNYGNLLNGVPGMGGYPGYPGAPGAVPGTPGYGGAFGYPGYGSYPGYTGANGGAIYNGGWAGGGLSGGGYFGGAYPSPIYNGGLNGGLGGGGTGSGAPIILPYIQ